MVLTGPRSPIFFSQLEREREGIGRRSAPCRPCKPPPAYAHGDRSLDAATLDPQIGGDPVVGRIATAILPIAVEQQAHQDKALQDQDGVIVGNAAHPIEAWEFA